MQTTRQFEILYTLLQKGSTTTKALAEKLQVSPRTIARDIDTLSLAGIPIYAERGKGGGVKLLPEFVMHKALLDEREQTQVLDALHGLGKVVEGGDQTLSKLSGIFNKTATNWLAVDFSDWSFQDNYFNLFKEAIWEGRVAQFHYYNSYGEKTFRSIQPIQLWFKSRHWYIRGYCLTKEAMRTYKLARIKDLTITDQVLPPRDIPSPEAEPDGTSMGTFVPITLRISQEMAYRAIEDFGESMIAIQPDGGYIVNVSWPIDNWVHGYILSFGEHIEVLAPPELKATIKAKAEKIVKTYL